MADQSIERESLIANPTHKRTDGEGDLEDYGDEELGTSNSELGLRRSLSLVDGIRWVS